MKKLNEEQKRILIGKGTEMPFTGKYLHNKEKGEYICASCGNKLFSSDAKYDSGSGWPSFYRTEKEAIKKEKEKGFLGRTEIMCNKCNGHLGHVFNDEPRPTGLRYCVNSAALNFKRKGK